MDPWKRRFRFWTPSGWWDTSGNPLEMASKEFSFNNVYHDPVNKQTNKQANKHVWGCKSYCSDWKNTSTPKGFIQSSDAEFAGSHRGQSSGVWTKVLGWWNTTNSPRCKWLFLRVVDARMILLMAEIRLTSWYVRYPIISKFLWQLPGGVGFLPSTVCKRYQSIDTNPLAMLHLYRSPCDFLHIFDTRKRRSIGTKQPSNQPGHGPNIGRFPPQLSLCRQPDLPEKTGLFFESLRCEF